MAPARVAIIGGGISGLATAYYLSKLGIRSTIVEKSNRLGGLIQTESIAECQIEAGPDSYLASKPAVTELAAELGDLKTHIIGSNDERRRVFVVRNGQVNRYAERNGDDCPGRMEAGSIFGTLQRED